MRVRRKRGARENDIPQCGNGLKPALQLVA